MEPASAGKTTLAASFLPARTATALPEVAVFPTPAAACRFASRSVDLELVPNRRVSRLPALEARGPRASSAEAVTPDLMRSLYGEYGERRVSARVSLP
jgi:hypothetical protein